MIVLTNFVEVLQGTQTIEKYVKQKNLLKLIIVEYNLNVNILYKRIVPFDSFILITI